MDRLSTEVLARVIECLRADEKLAPYSTTSRAFKDSIERLTFRTLSITTDELDTFAAAFSEDGVSRGTGLTSVGITFILPDPSNGISCCDAGQIIDREADGAAFTASVVKLFTILADIDARAIG